MKLNRKADESWSRISSSALFANM